MINVKPTPGPWVVQESENGGGLLIKPIPGQVVEQCDEVTEMKANAEFIVKACNAHEGLVVALSEYLQWRKDQKITTPYPEEVGLMAQAEAALAKAGINP